MKCINCKKKNVSQASYCIRCGYEFTDKDKENNKNSLAATVYRTKEVWDTITLSKIKDKWWYRILSFMFVVGLGVIMFIQNGTHLKILKSDNYEISKLKNTDNYYLKSPNKETKLNIYLPHEAANIYVDYYDESGNVISKNTYTDINDITILVNNNNNYYTIYIDDNNKVTLYPNIIGGEYDE